MTRLTLTVPPTLLREDGERREELLADLRSLVRIGDELPARDVTYSRPPVLSGLAALVAEHVPHGTHRLVGITEDAPLVIAVSLYTGTPAFIIDAGAASGQFHRHETAVAIGYTRDSAEAVLPFAMSEAVRVVRTITLFSTGSRNAGEPGEAAIFTYPELRFAQGDEQ